MMHRTKTYRLYFLLVSTFYLNPYAHASDFIPSSETISAAPSSASIEENVFDDLPPLSKSRENPYKKLSFLGLSNTAEMPDEAMLELEGIKNPHGISSFISSPSQNSDSVPLSLFSNHQNSGEGRYSSFSSEPIVRANSSTNPSLSALGLGEREKPDDNVLHENLLQKRKLKSRFDSNAPLEPIQNPYKKQKITNEKFLNSQTLFVQEYPEVKAPLSLFEDSMQNQYLSSIRCADEVRLQAESTSSTNLLESFTPSGSRKKGNSIKWVNQRVDKLYKDLQTFVQEYPFSTSTQSPEALSEIDKNRLNDVFDAISKYLEPIPDLFSDRSEFLKAFFDKLFTNVDSEDVDNKLKKICNDPEKRNKLKNIYICDIYGFSSRAIALLGQICPSLQLNYLEPLSPVMICKYLNKLKQNGKIKPYNNIKSNNHIELDNNEQQAPLPLPSSDENQETVLTPFFNLSKHLGILYAKQIKEPEELQNYLQMQLKTFIENTIFQTTQGKTNILSLNSYLEISEEEILNKTIDILLDEFQVKNAKLVRDNPSFNKKEFFKLFLDKLLINNNLEGFNNLIEKIKKKNNTCDKYTIYSYIYEILYGFELSTIKVLNYISSRCLNKKDYSNVDSLYRPNQLITKYANVKEDIERYFTTTTEDTNETNTHQNFLSNFNKRIKKEVYKLYKETIEKRQNSIKTPLNC